jgi:hypothetical protein
VRSSPEGDRTNTAPMIWLRSALVKVSTTECSLLSELSRLLVFSNLRVAHSEFRSEFNLAVVVVDSSSTECDVSGSMLVFALCPSD